MLSKENCLIKQLSLIALLILFLLPKFSSKANMIFHAFIAHFIFYKFNLQSKYVFDFSMNSLMFIDDLSICVG